MWGFMENGQTSQIWPHFLGMNGPGNVSSSLNDMEPIQQWYQVLCTPKKSSHNFFGGVRNIKKVRITVHLDLSKSQGDMILCMLRRASLDLDVNRINMAGMTALHQVMCIWICVLVFVYWYLCICVFVYLCICICVFVYVDLQFDLLQVLTFSWVNPLQGLWHLPVPDCKFRAISAVCLQSI